MIDSFSGREMWLGCGRGENHLRTEHRDAAAGGVGAGPSGLRAVRGFVRAAPPRTNRIVAARGDDDVEIADVVGLAIIEQVDAIGEGHGGSADLAEHLVVEPRVLDADAT